ncbi:MAG: alkaline phosphatase, partial [Pseudomonadota bacterium]
MAFTAGPARAGDNVIFFHPDGAGVNHWTAARMYSVGPDGVLHWDRLPAIGVYTGHMTDRLTGTSHGGATVHSRGVKVRANSFGLDGADPITVASAKRLSIAQEALAAGKAVGLVQSGQLAEPGTAAFVSESKSRGDRDGIAAQVIGSGAQVILAGGERYLLPRGVDGRHGPGGRRDGLNLVERAASQGYTVVYTREELLALDLGAVDKLLGVFAWEDTFNAQPSQQNIAEGLPHYVATAPRIAEMSAAALTILSRNKAGFLAVIEEEGTDNFPNALNAAGALEALRRADEALGVMRAFIEGRDDTLLLTTADSDAAGLQVYSGRLARAGATVASATRGGGLLHGQQGPQGDVFMAQPDANGVSLPFGVAFIGSDDVAGGVLVRGAAAYKGLSRPVLSLAFA